MYARHFFFSSPPLLLLSLLLVLLFVTVSARNCTHLLRAQRHGFFSSSLLVVSPFRYSEKIDIIFLSLATAPIVVDRMKCTLRFSRCSLGMLLLTLANVELHFREFRREQNAGIRSAARPMRNKASSRTSTDHVSLRVRGCL